MEADLKEMLTREPFVPFKIVLTGGDSYEVESPFQIAIGKSQLNYYYAKSDRKAILRLNQVAAFETLQDNEAA